MSCSSEELHQDERLMIIAEKVQSELSDRGVQFTIDMHLVIEEGLEGRENAWGVSYKDGNAIHISKFIYDASVKLDRMYRIESLMMHEIGHNKFGLAHEENPFDSLGNPLVMRTGMFREIPKEDQSKMYDAIVNSIQ